MFSILQQSKKVIENSGLSDDLETRFFEVARDMTIYASDDVLDLWVKFKNMGESADTKYVLALVGELMSAIRTDLGHTSSRFAAKDLLSTFVTDIDSIDLPAVR